MHASLARIGSAFALTAGLLPGAMADPRMPIDTGYHLGASFSLGAMGRTLSRDSVPIANPVLRGAVVALVPGVLKEVSDSRSAGNHFSGRDMAANLAGALAGAALGDRFFIVPTGLGDRRQSGVVIGIHGNF